MGVVSTYRCCIIVRSFTAFPGRAIGRPATRTSRIRLYVVMGWLCVIAAKELFANLTHISLIFLVLGGIFYTVGVVFYIWEKLPYNHAVWHIFVLGGSIFHYFSVLYTL